MAQYRITEIDDYEAFVGAEVVQRIRDKADKLKGLRVANFNSTYYGGGVAEIISSLTLLMNGLGLRTEWRVIQGTPDFFSITKKMHNALQGGEIAQGARDCSQKFSADALPRTVSRSLRRAVAGRCAPFRTWIPKTRTPQSGLATTLMKPLLTCLGQFARLCDVRFSLIALQHAIEEPDDKTVRE